MGLKKNTPLLPEDHVSRHVPWTKLRKDQDDNVVGVLGAAFKLRRDKDENYLSVTRVEHFSGNYLQQIHESIREVRKYYKVKPKSYFVVGKVSEIQQLYSMNNKKPVHIVSYPTWTKLIVDGSQYKNESHVSVRNLEQQDDELLELLAEDVWNDLYLNSSVP